MRHRQVFSDFCQKQKTCRRVGSSVVAPTHGVCQKKSGNPEVSRLSTVANCELWVGGWGAHEKGRAGALVVVVVYRSFLFFRSHFFHFLIFGGKTPFLISLHSFSVFFSFHKIRTPVKQQRKTRERVASQHMRRCCFSFVTCPLRERFGDYCSAASGRASLAGRPSQELLLLFRRGEAPPTKKAHGHTFSATRRRGRPTRDAYSEEKKVAIIMVKNVTPTRTQLFKEDFYAFWRRPSPLIVLVYMSGSAFWRYFMCLDLFPRSIFSPRWHA